MRTTLGVWAWTAVCFAFGMTSAASAGATLSWSVAKGIDQNGVQSLSDIACSSAGTLCTGVDTNGQAVTFDPSSPGGAKAVVVDAGRSIRAVACPTSTSCAAVDGAGYLVTFDPSAPGSAALDQIDAGNALRAIACPSAAVCAAVDASGNEVTFDPTNPASPAVTSIDDRRVLTSIDCPLVNLCVASVAGGHIVTFDPADAAGTTAVFPVASGASLVAVACPGDASPARCTTVDAAGNEYTFDPTSPGITAPTAVATGVVKDVACPSWVQCTVVNLAGQEYTFNPQSPGPQSPMQIDQGQQPAAVACPSIIQCVSVDGQGREVTFAPTAPAAPTGATIDAGARLDAIACGASSSCAAVDAAGGVVTFDPAAPAAAAFDQLDTAYYLHGIACAAADQCTAVDDTQELTFDPASPGSPAGGALDVGHQIQALACPSPGACVAVDEAGNAVSFTPSPSGAGTVSAVTIDSGQSLSGVACPAATRCIAVDQRGDEVTFDPTSTSTAMPVPVDVGQALAGVACPTPTQCTAVDTTGREATFDPTSPAHSTLTAIDTGHSLQAIACPAADDCIAVDDGGRAIEGDPTNPGAAWAVTALSGAGHLTAIACPSQGACVAVDEVGNAVVGRPIPVSTATPTIAGSARPGQTLTESHGGWTNGPTGYAYQWQSCQPSAAGCVPIAGATSQTYTLQSGDAGYKIRVAETAINPYGSSLPATSAPTPLVSVAPTAQSPPRIAGAATVGQTLTSSTGSWSGTAPISYSYQWERCHPGCSPIGGATAARYRLGAADLGARIAVILTAANNAGNATATSPELGPVALSSVVVARSLGTAIRPTGGASRIRALRKSGRYRASFVAPAAGLLELDWYQVPKGVRVTKVAAKPNRRLKPILVARGRLRIERAGRVTVVMRLTAAGKRMLRHSKRLRLTGKATFAPTVGSRFTTIASFTLRL